jgi:HEPN domain-containing protein
MNAEMDLARQWWVKAENDLINADNNLKSEVIPYDTVSFHCQQAAEKLLRAYLYEARQAAQAVLEWLKCHLEGLFPGEEGRQ